MPPTYYRGCWHVVSRDLLVRYRHRMNSYSHSCSSLTTEFYDPKTFFTHAALLHQTCVHCGRFPTAASRKIGRASCRERVYTYYRGCWHVVSRDFLSNYRQIKASYYLYPSSPTTELYDPKTFFAHAALLHQTCVHCGRFPTAASRRSLGRVSVPMWPINLSVRLRIITLVGRYPTN